MRLSPLPLLALLAAASHLPEVAGGATDDPLTTPACLQARAALDEATQRLRAEAPVQGPTAAQRQPAGKPAAALASLRQEAARACLGATAPTAPRTQPLTPPATAALPAGVAGPAAVPLPPAPSAPPPAVPLPRPAAITSCDPGGCWTSEGRRLERQGPLLLGPQGALCSQQGGVVSCP